MNEDQATIDTMVRVRGVVRKKKAGKFDRYKYYIHTEEYGNLFFQTEQGQQLIIGAMEEIREPAPPEPETPFEQEPEKQPESKPAPKQKTSLIDSII